MADTVTVKKALDGERNVVYELTNKSDGTGESAVKKIDMVNLVPQPGSVRIDWIEYDIGGMEVELLWEGTPDVSALKLTAGQGILDMRHYGGLTNDASNKTGNILLTTSNAGSGDSYSIIIGMVKKEL